MHGEEARARADVGDARARLDRERLDDLVGPPLGVEPRLLARTVVAVQRRAAARRLALRRFLSTSGCEHQAQQRYTHESSVAEKKRWRPKGATGGCYESVLNESLLEIF